VIARGAEVLSTGFHARAGEAHAEVRAFDAARDDVKGATLYVSLEPCAHQGRTPPCTERVLQEGIARVVVAVSDPNPKVYGRGIAQLREAGVVVDVREAGPLHDEAKALIAPFRRALVDRMPFVVAKVAASLDGRIATRTGHARFVTGAPARRLVHALRDRCDAILVGAGTVLADDPELTVRDPQGGIKGTRNPWRVVVDGTLRTSPRARVYEKHERDAARQPLVLHHAGAPEERRKAFDDAGVARLEAPSLRGKVDLAAGLSTLVDQGITSVLVEPGPGLFGPLLREGLVDALWWFTAPVVVGGDGVPAVPALELDAMDQALRLHASRYLIGDDALVVGSLDKRSW
jgi:diaminohydroxyphosphoribosylaminopyrimidine deaminase/5-amino-6-(5-phosphoribosylamino)uracil reductase